MRKSRLVVFVVAALASAVSFAGAQSTAPNSATTARTGQGAKHRARGELLRGVTLSAAEKSKLAETHARYQSETKSLRQSLKPAMLEARTARQKGDTGAARAALEKTKGDREKLRAVMARQKNDFRAALTPEHQQQFDANVKQATERRASAKKARGGKGHVGSRQKKVLVSPNA